MKKGTIIIIAVVAVLAILIGSVVSSYNSLATAREEVAAAESNIDTYLQRRADLIPNLVKTAKQYAAHETDVFDKVLEAREKLVGADTVSEKAEADAELSSALQSFNLIVENYPELTSNTTFIQVMDELAGSENRIATARKDYNDTVNEYNSKIIKFPTSLVAGMFGFEKAEYFEAAEGAETTPDVDELFGE